MQQVITAKQARQITGGRKPLVPVVYEEAVKALGECISLDDAKVWSDKADALAAWAKIYHDGKVERQAKALKLHAFRRMGELAREIHPDGRRAPRRPDGSRGSTGGARAALIRAGLSSTNAQAATTLSRLSKDKVAALAELPRIPSPQRAVILVDVGKATERWKRFRNCGLNSMRSLCGREDPVALVADLRSSNELSSAITLVRDIAEWCDVFLQAAGK